MDGGASSCVVPTEVPRYPGVRAGWFALWPQGCGGQRVSTAKGQNGVPGRTPFEIAQEAVDEAPEPADAYLECQGGEAE